MSRILILTLLLICTFGSSAQPTLSQKVRESIDLRISNGKNIGIVIGLIDSDGIAYYNYGVKSLQSNEPVDEKTIFEIGSISKAFTGILLADQVKKGLMNLNDLIDLHLPDGVMSPTFNGESIQLIHLANHTSGLPRLPSNLAPADPANPYADYTEAHLYEFLNGYELAKKPGVQYEYSNLGAGLLGHLLAAKNGVTYEDLMLKVIAKELGLKNTKITLNSKMEKNLATGHSMEYEVSNWDLPTLAGAGAIRSTVEDMAKFVQINMGLKKHYLYETMQLSHQNTRSGDLPEVGLGWHRAGAKGEIVWHNGGTGGYRSFIGFHEIEKKGVVILTNSSESADDIGFHFLNEQSPLRTIKPSIAAEVREVVDEEGLNAGIAAFRTYWETEPDSYEFGEYELLRLANMYQLKNEKEKAIAMLKLNIEAYPNSSNSYSSLGESYFKADRKEAAINQFKKAVSLNPANAHALTRLKALGVDSESLTAEVVVPTEILESYTGQYQLAPGFIVTISRDQNQLNAQATGQQAFPIYPKSDSVFYFKAVEAQLTFNKGAEDKVESVTLNQGGREIVGRKM